MARTGAGRLLPPALASFLLASIGGWEAEVAAWQERSRSELAQMSTSTCSSGKLDGSAILSDWDLDSVDFRRSPHKKS